MACLLTRTWSGSEATAIWVEHIAERKKDIAKNTDPLQIQSIPARVAAQQEISRTELAMWDTSARAWLLSADEVKNFDLTQLRLIIKDSGLFVSSIGSTYASVIEVWTIAMRALQDLILGKPQRTSRGALLIGLSAWHIFPDLNVIGPIAYVKFNDSLIEKGGMITLGLQSTSPDEDPGVQWSLSLSHLRYYGEPVRVSTNMGPNGSRISMEDLQVVALGSLFGIWGRCVTDPLTGAEMIVALVSRLAFKSEGEFEMVVPGLHLLWCTAKRLLAYSELERQSALCLIAFWRRRARGFLTDRLSAIAPAFGLSSSRTLWNLVHGDKDIRKSITEEIEELRKFAKLCGFSCEDCVIRYPRTTVANAISENDPNVEYGFTTALVYDRESRKRRLDSTPSRKSGHISWVPKSIGPSIPIPLEAELALPCDFCDPNDIREVTGGDFYWIDPPKPYQSDSHFSKLDLDTESASDCTDFYYVAGNHHRARLFCSNRDAVQALSDVQITKMLEMYDPISATSFLYMQDLFDGGLKISSIEERRKRGLTPTDHLCESLMGLARAASFYRQLPGATVSLSVVRHPMYEVKCFYDLAVSLSAKFACIAMFET